LGARAGRLALARGPFAHRPEFSDTMQLPHSIPVTQSPGFTFLCGAAEQVVLKIRGSTSPGRNRGLPKIGEALESASVTELPGGTSLPDTKDFMDGVEADSRGCLHGSLFGSIDTLGGCLHSGATA